MPRKPEPPQGPESARPETGKIQYPGKIQHSPERLARALGLPEPTAQQAAVIAAPLAPMLVVAGAGSGKTETMAARVVWLVANGLVRPENILGLTFTRKAAGELTARIRGRLALLTQADLLPSAGDPTVSTYHAYALRVLAEHGVRAGFEPEVRLLGEAASWQYADAVVNVYDGDMSAVDAAPSTVTAEVLNLSAQLAEQLRTPRDLTDWLTRLHDRVEGMPAGKKRTPAAVAKFLELQRRRAQLVPLVERYGARKLAAQATDYGDQLARAARLAAEHTEVGAAERDRFRVVLLDEYQDTSYAQLSLLSALFGGGHPVIAVGDPCQAIYGWRGASAGNLGRFPRDFPRRDTSPARVRPLTVSWRNTPAILGVANALSAPLRNQTDSVTVPDLLPRPGENQTGRVRCALLESVDAEAGWVAAAIAAAWRETDVTPTTAVLVRTRANIDRYATALRAEGLPVEIVGLGGLLAVPEVCDVVATLRVLVDPGAGDALIRLLTGARWRIGPRDLVALRRRATALAKSTASTVPVEPGVTQPSAPSAESTAPAPPEVDPSIIEALDDVGPAAGYSPAGYERLTALRAELASLRGRIAEPLPELVAAVETTLRLDIEVPARETSKNTDVTSARANLDAFIETAADFAETTEHPTLSSFLAYLDAAEREERGLPVGRVEVHPGAVQLLTIHASKGLEWDVVAVPGMSEKDFPAMEKQSGLWSKNAGALPFALRGDRRDLPPLDLSGVSDHAGLGEKLAELSEAWVEHQLAEERRLAYVAVTRARRLLLCSGYWWGSRQKPSGPSEFLTELAAAAEDSPGVTIDDWSPTPESETNPLLAEPVRADWPTDPLGERRTEVANGAALVFGAMRGSLLDEAELEPEVGREWFAEAELLLAERAKRRPSGTIEVELPEQLSVSQLVGLVGNSPELARAIHRPLPRPPAPVARRGSAFHAWLERRSGNIGLLDLDELPGSADAEAEPDGELVALQEAFNRGAWADRIPARVEVPFAMTLGPVAVRGRMDAVFKVDGAAGEEPSWEVVDWKTGSVPRGERAQVAAVQLAMYRLAWAQLAGVPVERVRAGFHYVTANVTLWPADLLTAEELTELLTSLPVAHAD